MKRKDTYCYPEITEYSEYLGFPGSSVVKNPPANAGNIGSIPGSRRSPGEGNGNPLQYSCLGKPIDRGAWCATVHGVSKESDITERLNNSTEVSCFVGHPQLCPKL